MARVVHITNTFGNYPVFLQIDHLERTAGDPEIPVLARRDIVESHAIAGPFPCREGGDKNDTIVILGVLRILDTELLDKNGMPISTSIFGIDSYDELMSFET